MKALFWTRIHWLVRFDLRQQRRDRGTRVLMIAALLLAGFALLQGDAFRRAERQAAERSVRQQDDARAAAANEAKRYFAAPADPRYAELKWYRVPFDLRGYAFREQVDFAVEPALPGAALAIGQGDLLPSVVRVRAESMDSVRNTAEIEHPNRLAAGRFDLLFFVVYLWPLVLLALCLSVLTHDREVARLTVLALQGVTPRQLLLSQVLARSLCATLVLVATIGVLAFGIGALPASAAGLVAWMQWTACVAAYSLVWAAIACVVGARAADRTTAAFGGFGAWVFVVILLPAVLAAVAGSVAPLPVAERYVVAMRDANDRVNADRLTYLQRFYDEHPEWRPATTALAQVSSSVGRLIRAEELERALLPVEQEFTDANARQAALLRSLGPVSPAGVAYEALSAIAGHDARRHERFVAEVRTHQLALRDFFQVRLQQAALADERAPCAVTCKGGFGFDDFDAVPRFAASAALRASPALGVPLAVMAIWTALLLLAAIRMTRPSAGRVAAPAASNGRPYRPPPPRNRRLPGNGTERRSTSSPSHTADL